MVLDFTKAAIQAAVLIVSWALVVTCTSTSWATTTEYIFTSTTSSTTSSLTSTEEFLEETTTDSSTTITYPSTTSSTTSSTTTTQSETTTESETSSSIAYTTTSGPSTTTSHPETTSSQVTTATSHPATTATNADRTTTIPSTTTSPDVQNDTCSNSPCRNGGLCRTTLQSYTCYCPSGFSGELCDTEKDEQTKVPVSVLAGALVGCIVLFSAIIIVIVCIFRKKNSKGGTFKGSSNPNSLKDRKLPGQETMWIQDEPLRLYEPMADTNSGSETQTEGSNYADLQKTTQEDTYDQLNTAPQYVQMGQIRPQLSQEFTTSGQDRSSTYYVNQL